MPDLRPFSGVRYTQSDRLGDLICPPYDVISPAEQRALYERHPHNAVRLELPVAERQDEPRQERYRRARAVFDEWLRAAVLARDRDESLYVYRQDFVTAAGARRSVTGFIGALALERFGDDSGVLPHERTMPGPIEDRLTLLRAFPVNVSPIYAIYRGSGAVAPFYDSLNNRPPTGRFSDDSGSLHRVWAIPAPAEIEMLRDSAAAGPLVIADGHHRYETALAFLQEKGDGRGGHDAIMTFAVDADAGELEVLPYNRTFMAPMSEREIAAALEAHFATKTFPAGQGTRALHASSADHPMLFVLPGADVLVEVSRDELAERLPDRAPAWRALDVVALHEVVLPEALGERPEKIRFTHDAGEVVDLVRGGGWSAGVLLEPMRAAQVIDVATSGERMPQKASYFWPKAVTGLAFRELV